METFFNKSNISTFINEVIEYRKLNKNFYKDVNQNLEVEVRFFFNTSIDVFNRIKNEFIPNEVKAIKSTDYFYTSDDNVRVRFTKYQDSINRVIKVRIADLDNKDFSTRISANLEINEEVDDIPVNEPTLIRNKRRYSIILNDRGYDNYRLDLTQVDGKYEIELELLDPYKLDDINQVTSMIMKYIQNTDILYTTNEQLDVIKNINISLGSSYLGNRIDYGRLAKARNIKMRDLVKGGITSIVANSGTTYAASIKIDGDRKLLVFDPNGIFFAYPPNSLNKIVDINEAQRYHDWFGTIFEGELYNNDFYLFDTLSISTTKAVIQSRNLEDRIKLFDTVITMTEDTLDYNIKRLIFYRFTSPEEFFSTFRNIIDKTYEYPTDGVIITPYNHSYVNYIKNIPVKSRSLEKYPEMIKWKPENKLTIDFRVKKVGNKFELYSGDNILFKGNRRFPYNGKVIDKDNIIKNAANNSIIEFKWNNGFIPARIRYDKTQPNRLDVALDIWEDINIPITEEVLKGNKFSLIFNLHNRIKSRLLNGIGDRLESQSREIRSLLSIGGSDLSKWKEAGFTHIIVVESNGKNRKKLRKRSDNFNIKILTSIDEVEKVVNDFIPGGKVNVISYMLTLSLYFDNDESIDTIGELIDNVLMIGGYWIAFTINGEKVINFFNDKNNFKEDNNILVSNFKQITFNFDKDNDSILTDDRVEYLVNLEEITNREDMRLVQLIDDINDNERVLLNEEEIRYNNLFSTLVMEKIE